MASIPEATDTMHYTALVLVISIFPSFLLLLLSPISWLKVVFIRKHHITSYFCSGWVYSMSSDHYIQIHCMLINILCVFLQRWVMKRQTIIGKKNYHQMQTEVWLRSLFVPSNCLTKIVMIFHVELGEFVNSFSSLLFWTILGTFRYEGKSWVAKNAKQPPPKPVEMGTSSNKLVEGGATSSKKLRRHSLEEAILVKHLAQDAPPVARPRPVILIYIFFVISFWWE